MAGKLALNLSWPAIYTIPSVLPQFVFRRAVQAFFMLVYIAETIHN
jgi:hypothetical protein